MSLLVTGCAGFIGSNFVSFYLKKYPNRKMVGLDLLTYAGNLDNLGLNEKVPGTGKRIEAKLGITQKMDQNRAFFSSCRTTEKNKMNIAA